MILRAGSDVGMTRVELDHAMRAALLDLATCSHVPAANPQGASRAGDETKGGNRPPGDLGPEEYARAYGPPFHTCTPRCDHRARPATTDQQRLVVLNRVTDEVENLRGHGKAHEPRPAGESADQLRARIVKDGRGWAVRDAAVHFRCGEQFIRDARRNGTVTVDGDERTVDIETGEPTAPRNRRGRPSKADATGSAAVARRARIHDLVNRRGHTIAAAARIVGVTRQTVRRDLGQHDDQTQEAA